MRTHKEIILGVTASVAIYKACDLIRRLREKGCNVTVVMTEEAERLITKELFCALSKNRVYQGLFESAETWEIEHVSLAEKADVVLIAPATANVIAKIAAGMCDDLLTCVVAATKAPVLLCPAMNENMYLNPFTQENIKKLVKNGFEIVAPKKGTLACGKEGVGCLAEIDTIVAAALKG